MARTLNELRSRVALAKLRDAFPGPQQLSPEQWAEIQADQEKRRIEEQDVLNGIRSESEHDEEDFK